MASLQYLLQLFWWLDRMKCVCKLEVSCDSKEVLLSANLTLLCPGWEVIQTAAVYVSFQHTNIRYRVREDVTHRSVVTHFRHKYTLPTFFLSHNRLQFIERLARVIMSIILRLINSSSCCAWHCKHLRSGPRNVTVAYSRCLHSDEPKLKHRPGQRLNFHLFFCLDAAHLYASISSFAFGTTDDWCGSASFIFS